MVLALTGTARYGVRVFIVSVLFDFDFVLQNGAPPHNNIALLQFLLFIELQTVTRFWKLKVVGSVEAVGAAGPLRNIANYIVAWTGDHWSW